MVYIGWALLTNIIGLVWPIITAIKQKHYKKRDDAVYCGLSLILIAFGLVVDNPELKLGVPLYSYPLIHGLLGIGLVVKRENIGLKILSGWASVAMGAIVLIFQIFS